MTELHAALTEKITALREAGQTTWSRKRRVDGMPLTITELAEAGERAVRAGLTPQEWATYRGELSARATGRGFARRQANGNDLSGLFSRRIQRASFKPSSGR